MKTTITLVTMMAAGFASAQNLIKNGSFEKENGWSEEKVTYLNTELDLTGKDKQTSGVVLGNDEIGGWQYNGHGILRTTAPKGTSDGIFALAISDEVSKNPVKQGFSFAQTGKHVLSFDTFTEAESSTTLTFSVDGKTQLIFGDKIEEKANGGWTSHSYTFDVTKDDIGLGILSLNVNSPMLFIDNVSITAVPEPSTTILGALGALALLRRRR